LLSVQPEEGPMLHQRRSAPLVFGRNLVLKHWLVLSGWS
jgi:hypothetical protein